MQKLNNHFRVVFQPKNPELYGKRRFCCGVYSLWKYVGRDNANKAILRALNSKDIVCTILLRKFGRIDFYSK